MDNADSNKETIRNFIETVWGGQDLASLPDFWTTDCINHAMPGSENIGLDALRAYHESFFAAFSAFSDVHMAVTQQIAEGDRVMTQITTSGEHSGLFYGIAPTGKRVSMSAIRLDRLEKGKIAEHWSVSDAAGLAQQLQA